MQVRWVRYCDVDAHADKRVSGKALDDWDALDCAGSGVVCSDRERAILWSDVCHGSGSCVVKNIHTPSMSKEK